MAVNALVLSFGKTPFSESLAEFLNSKGCNTVVEKNAAKISKEIPYVVVLNMDGKFSSDRNLRKKISDLSPKVVVINSAEDKEGLLIDGVRIKQIYIDNLIPFFTKPLEEVTRLSRNQNASIPKQAWLAITDKEQLFEKIASELFSFPEEKRYLFGKLVSYREIINTLNPNTEISIDFNAYSRLPRKDLEIIESYFDLSTLPKLGDKSEKVTPPKVKTAKHLKEKKTPFKFLAPKISFSAPRIKAPGRTKYVFAFSVSNIIVLLLLPYLFLALSIGASGMSYKYFKDGNLYATKKTISVAGIFASASEKVSILLSGLPVIGESISSTGRTAKALSMGTNAVGRVLAISDYATDFSDNIFASDEDINNLSSKLSVDLMSLYRDLSFIDGEAKEGNLPFSNMIPYETISEYRSYILTASKLASNLPSLLGYDKPKTYLLLLQNNMELRPTGGFIGSFALLTFSKGDLIDNTIYDVYSADGQLKGYIEPPKPIEEYLGEASWTLRDSNWDPNFPISATRAEWFLDKSIDRNVDGVIAIDLEAARKYLETLGSLSLPDFGDTIDSKNMYEKVQYEVENDFFPGSRKKAHYLSSLATALIDRIKSSTSEEAMSLTEATINSLNSRDIQIYLHDESAASVFDEQKWNGSVSSKKCDQDNCTSLLAGVVEANLGVNKANYFIDRKVSTEITQLGSDLKVQLSLKIKNNAPGRNIPEERYKDYVRVLANDNAKLPQAYIDKDGGRKYLDVDTENLVDRVEYGALIDVNPREEQTITFEWKLPASVSFTKAGKLIFNWWKQSGVGEYPFEARFNIPSLNNISSSPPLSLTKEGSLIYNTNLDRDQLIDLTWGNTNE